MVRSLGGILEGLLTLPQPMSAGGRANDHKEAATTLCIEALVDAAACEDLVETTHRLATAGALGVVFIYERHGLGGLALGDAAAPRVRAVVVERAVGLELARACGEQAPGESRCLAWQEVYAELKQGKLIAEDSYEVWSSAHGMAVAGAVHLPGG